MGGVDAGEDCAEAMMAEKRNDNRQEAPTNFMAGIVSCGTMSRQKVRRPDEAA